MNDVECPYCDEPQEINHDDGYGYEEGKTYEQRCKGCDKYFAFTTSISFYYDAEKADCLNGADHKLKMSTTYPKKYSTMCCVDCSFERKPTKEEFEKAGINIEEV